MADKLLRDELLRSHRYHSVSNDTARLLFVHLILASDSLSNAEATTTSLSIIMGRTMTEEISAALLSELGDKDLVRVYHADGKRYVHIPRSRQRIRYLSGKHPRPPDSVEDIGIKALIDKVGLKSDRGQTAVIPFTPEVKRSDVKQRSSGELSTGSCGQVAAETEVQTEPPAGTWAEHWKAKGKALGINARNGETIKDYCNRVVAFEKGRRR